MAPKDFKERIVTNVMDQEVKLNYLKWLTQGLEIDIFEILTILTLYSRGSMYERLKIIFLIFCTSPDAGMTEQEFEFAVGKICTSIGSTLSVKKTILHDIVELKGAQIIPNDKDSLSEDDFLKIMITATRDFTFKLQDFNDRINVFNACVKKDRLPNYLLPGGVLLGKFQIEQAISYRSIIMHSLREKTTVFPPKKKPDLETMSAVSGRTGRKSRIVGRSGNDNAS